MNLTGDNSIAIEEILSRVRRIETKLTRFVTGESDRPPNVKVEVWSTAEGLEVDATTLNVPLFEVLAAVKDAGHHAETPFLVCENGKPRAIIRGVQ